MNLGGVIQSFRLPGGLTATRYSPGSYVDGLWVDGGTEQVAFDPVAVMPLTGKEVEVLPEGLRSKNAIQLLSTVQPKAADESAGSKGDAFTYDGQTFEVRVVENWSALAGYWRAVAVEVDG
jgi:hypothetical protein